MSLKDQAGFVKEALSSDEKVLESAFKLEKLYKKHKFKLWTVIALLVLFFAGRAGIAAYEESRLNAANEALLTLQQNPDDKTALSTLKEKNPNLYELFSYMNAVKKRDKEALAALGSSTDEIISDISRYHAAVAGSKVTDSVYYNDLVLVAEAYEALKKGNKDIAKQKLSLIAENSPVSNIANLLKHYTIEVKK